MARYYFNMQDGASFPNDCGKELETLRQARMTAVDYVAEMLRSPDEGLWKGQKSSLRVTDARGAVLFTLAFCATTPVLALCR